MVLEQTNVNPDTPNTKYSQTPLYWAAANSHQGVVRMLLEQSDINPILARPTPNLIKHRSVVLL